MQYSSAAHSQRGFLVLAIPADADFASSLSSTGSPMADFKTHLSVSTAVGIGYGAAGYAVGFEPSTCLVAGGLCSISGILPDLDSDSGKPVREIIAFTAAVIPALMIPRFHQMGLNAEQIALAAGVIYLVIRYGVGKILRRCTVHRGMWHSIPAAAIAGLIAFLVVSGTVLDVRLFKTIAVVLGFLAHLVLDEIWSLQVRRGRLRIKRSFGTAMKFWSNRSLWPNLSTYGKLAGLVVLVIGDPFLMQQMGFDESPLGNYALSPAQQAANGAPTAPLEAAESTSAILPEWSQQRQGGSADDADARTASRWILPGDATPPSPSAPSRRPSYYPTR